MSEPTIYKPSIYKGNGIYKNGGGGGADYHIWYDDIPYYAYKGGNGPNFNLKGLLNTLKASDIIETKLKWTLWNSIMVGYGLGFQGGSNEFFGVEIGGFQDKIDFIIKQPYNAYLRTYGNANNALYVFNTTHEIDCIKTMNGINCYLDGVLNSYNLSTNSSSSWYVEQQYYPFFFYQAGGIGPICNFYEQTIKDYATLEEKLKFIPVKRKIDKAQGILEIYSGIFTSPGETVNYEDYPL